MAFGDRTAGKHTEILENERTRRRDVAEGGGGACEGKCHSSSEKLPLWGTKHCILRIASAIPGLMG